MRSGISALLLFCAAVSLYARGKKEAPPPVLNAEYVLCVTAFDVSSLPVSQRVLGSLFQNRFTARLAEVNVRMRTREELDRYEEAAWYAARNDAAGKLTAKRTERDELLFKGFASWKYKKDLKKIEQDIGVLETQLAETENAMPVIAAFPAFRLSDAAFPVPPEKDTEEAFLIAQGADAFISGRLSVYYGRIYTEIRLYTRYDSFIYEDAVIFSIEDLYEAADELLERMEEAAAGSERAKLVVRAEPEESSITVNGKLAAGGEALTLNPGEALVSLSADGYEPFSGRIELASGEKAEIGLALIPLAIEVMKISMPEQTGRIYLGALYIGSLPPSGDFEISVPARHYRYIDVETDDGQSGRAIVLGTEGQNERVVPLKPRVLPGVDEKPVEKRRRQFYGAWGRLWITLPLAVLISGIAQSYATAYNSSGNATLKDNARISSNISTGAWAAVGLFGAESLIRLFVYIGAANREAVPLWK